MQRVILHVDMDAFFASVEQRDDPVLRGKPVLVGGSAGRGVVTAASYEARRFGCRSAMPMAQALRLCPQAVCVKGRHGVYGEVSRQVMEVLAGISPDVQKVSVDEAYVDCTGVTRLWGDGPAIAQLVRSRVREAVDLPCSVGIGPNKFLAKVASDLAKPDGWREITAQAAAATLAPLPVTVLRGVGPAAAERLAKLRVRTVADYLATDLGMLRRAFGEQAEVWARMAVGHDDRPVAVRGEAAKSIGKEQTFSEDVGDPERLRATLLAQCEAVARHLRADGLRARTVTIKVRLADFSTFTRSRTMDEPADTTERIWRTAAELLEEWVAANPAPATDATGARGVRGHTRALRLLGVSLHELTDQAQLGLFDQPDAERLEKVDRVADAIAERFGKEAIGRARAIGGGRKHKRPGGGPGRVEG
ncbi:MAG: DNA polymerase IV [bacterium]|jgi:DNA polymerase-4